MTGVCVELTIDQLTVCVGQTIIFWWYTHKKKEIIWNIYKGPRIHWVWFQINFQNMIRRYFYFKEFFFNLLLFMLFINIVYGTVAPKQKYFIFVASDLHKCRIRFRNAVHSTEDTIDISAFLPFFSVFENHFLEIF